MKRVSKSPEERRRELMDCAENLFIEKGFQATMVSDIVKKLGVAQGTFYYYFKSKDEILNALIERDWDNFLQDTKIRLTKVNNGYQEELKTILGSLFTPVKGNIGIKKYFVEGTDNQDIIEDFHRHFDEIRVKVFLPEIKRVVLGGIDEGIFIPLKHTEEIIEAIFYGINTYMHIYAPSFNNLETFKKKISGLEELLEIVLGVPKGTLGFNMLLEG